MGKVKCTVTLTNVSFSLRDAIHSFPWTWFRVARFSSAAVCGGDNLIVVVLSCVSEVEKRRRRKV